MKLSWIILSLFLITLFIATPSIAGGIRICDLKPNTLVAISPIDPPLPVTVEANANNFGVFELKNLTPVGTWIITKSDDKSLIGMKIPIGNIGTTSVNCVKLFNK